MRLLAFMGVVVAAGGIAGADTFNWDWNVGDPGNYGISNSGGTFESINASFSTDTNMLSWKITFSDRRTTGITLATSDGPNPKGHAGELAILYLDAENINTPHLLAYGYNGTNSRTSFQDGDGNVSGNQAPDIIHDRNDTSWIQSLSVADVAGGKRVFDFTIDASYINGYSPEYPDAQDPWFGIGWGEKLGLWLHTYRSLDASYGSVTAASGDTKYALKKWDRYREGYFDGNDFETDPMRLVPLPGAAAMGLAGMGLVGLRRRRAAR
ncbi:MAG: hypothetical protein H6811_02285 [Phycisphaeraceae bacterium]|nr:hypothetical protein [Phycisphaeraceae bacterium]